MADQMLSAKHAPLLRETCSPKGASELSGERENPRADAEHMGSIPGQEDPTCHKATKLTRTATESELWARNHNG